MNCLLQQLLSTLKTANKSTNMEKNSKSCWWFWRISLNVQSGEKRGDDLSEKLFSASFTTYLSFYIMFTKKNYRAQGQKFLAKIGIFFYLWQYFPQWGSYFSNGKLRRVTPIYWTSIGNKRESSVFSVDHGF